MCDGSESESKNHLAVPNSLRPHGLHGILPARILEWASFLQGIFPVGNPALPHCRRTLYQLSHQESPTVS